MQVPAINHAASSELPKPKDKPSSKAPEKQDYKLKELMKKKIREMSLLDDKGRVLTAEQIEAVIDLQPIYHQSPPIQKEYHLFLEKESKWLLDMYQRRSLDNGVDFLSLWSFDVFEMSKELGGNNPLWKKWQQVFLSRVLSAFLSFSSSKSDAQNDYYVRGDKGAISHRLPSNKELALCIRDLCKEGEQLSQKSAESEQYDKGKWRVVAEGLDLGARLFLNNQAKLIFSKQSICTLAQQFKDSHLIEKEELNKNIDELFRYIIFVNELNKNTDEQYSIKESYFETLAKRLSSLGKKQPISQANLQEFRYALVKQMIKSEKVATEIYDKLALVRNGILNKKDLKHLRQNSLKEYIQILDRQLHIAQLMKFFLVDVNRFFARIAHTALPDSYLDGVGLCNRINVNLAVEPERTAAPYLDLFRTYFPKSSQSLAGALNLEKEMQAVLLKLMAQFNGLPSLDQLPDEQQQELVNCFNLVLGCSREKDPAYSQWPQILICYQQIQQILDSIKPQNYDFNRLKKQAVGHFYFAFSNLPPLYVIQHKAELLQLAQDWMLLSLKHIVSISLVKDDLQQLLGQSVNGRTLEDVLLDGFIDCVEMTELEERLNKWIEEVVPAPSLPKVVVPSGSLSSVSMEQRSSFSSSSKITLAAPVAAASAASLAPPSVVQKSSSVDQSPSAAKRSKAQAKPSSGSKVAALAIPVPRDKDQDSLDDLRRRGVKRREIVARLRKLGFRDVIERRGGGSHEKMHLEGIPGSLIVPRHNQFKPKTLNSIIDQAEEALAKKR